MQLVIPKDYDPILDVRQTQEAIKYIRDTFQKEFGREMHLSRISAPLFVPKSTGLNDNLNGIERPVSFDIAEMPNETIEVVQSLAKWKRFALKKYNFAVHDGLYTNMNAIRRDEELDNLHSVYVDQWDWEKVITKEERTEAMLEETVRTIFKVIKHMERALEISSMGIRVDENSIVEQCHIRNAEERLHYPYHQMIQKCELPYTIGGGIGQSRLCMLLLNKAHVGEVQASIWPQDMVDECEAHQIHLL